MAQVMFKRGTQENLGKLTNAQIKDGCFYLTTDTNRFYVGKSTGENTAKLEELNQSVTTVAAVANLPTENIDNGQFYYAKSENILCVYDKNSTSKWIQINPDTRLNSTNTGLQAATDSNVTKLILSASDTNHNMIQGVVDIVGGTNVTVSSEAVNDEVHSEHNSKITITATDTTYSMSADTATIGSGATVINAAAVKLSDGTAANDKIVKIYGDELANVSKDDNGIKVTVNDPVTSNTLAFVTKDNVTGLQSDVQIAGTSHKSNIVIPTIKYGNTTQSATFSQTDSATGVSELLLDVYTADEIDAMLTAAQGQMDAMEYKGTIASKEALAALTQVQKGATYKAANTTVFQIDGVDVHAGDLIIFNAPDNTAVTSGTPATLVETNWDVIPSGDDQTIVGNLGTHTMSISDGSGVLGGITLQTTADKCIALTDKEGENATTKIIDIQHGAAGPKNGTKSSDNSGRTYIQDIEVDEFGHIRSIGTATEDYTNALTSVAMNTSDVSYASGSTTGADITTSATTEKEGAISGKFRVESQSLAVDAYNTILNEDTDDEETIPTVSVELNWGSF